MQQDGVAQNEALLISPIFQGLTRRPTLLGVDYHYIIFSGLLIFLLFINLKSLWVIALILPAYFMGWILCHLDPDIFSVLRIKLHIGVVRNRPYWRCQSYEAY